MVDSPAQSLALIRAAFSGSEEPAAVKARAMIALNAGAAIYLGGQAESHRAGVERALEALNSGAALKKLEQLAAFSQQF